MPSAGGIEFSRVSLSYDNGVYVLSEVSFIAQPARVTVLLGPSGCGKTTALKLIAGLIQPTAGTVTVDGKAPEVICRAGKIGITFQQPSLMPWRNIKKNICLPLEILHRQVDSNRIAELMELAEIDKKDISKKPRELSGGMAQRVALARALSTGPDFLLLDEPFASLDQISRNKLDATLSKILPSINATTILVTHNVAEALFLADEILMMEMGTGRITHQVPVQHSEPRDEDLFYDSTFRNKCADYEKMLSEMASKPGVGTDVTTSK